MRRGSWWREKGVWAGLALVLVVPAAAQVSAPTALQRALAGTSAQALVLDANSGRVLARAGRVEQLATPGSTLKPFVLLAALQRGVIRPDEVLGCKGELQVGGRNLACTHPAALRSFTGESALAYSCNSYFAEVARRLSPAALRQAFETLGLHARGSADAPEKRVLLALGLEGIEVSPMQLAEAYRRLAQAMEAGVPGMKGSALQVVERGMLGSASYGMANNAATDGVRLAAKTGTASELGQAWTHGWFAGVVYGADGKAHEVVVIYVPRGSGAEAALLAHRFLLAGRGR